ncbi:MAG: tyrosine--tRNA ligase, partial [Nitrosopumilaceae archaeon]
MDVTEKVDLIEKPPTEEIVTREELIELFKTNSSPKHYIGIEISGFLHLGSLISTGFKINDFLKAGVNCTVFLADWHTVINDKLGGDWDIITKVSKYYSDAFKLVCPGVNVVLGSDLYDSRKEYWSEFVRFTKHMSLARTMRTLTIMGRSEKDEKIDLAKLLYPSMQAVDIHSLDLDIVHAGIDQRKIHMLVRDLFPKMKWKVPVAVHHRLLPGLSQPSEIADDSTLLGKMSKSDPKSGILIHDSDDEIQSKIKKAWCEEGNTENNPLLEISKHIIFHKFDEMKVDRPEKFGGSVEYSEYSQLESDFGAKKLHPSDLKQTVANYLVKIIG